MQKLFSLVTTLSLLALLTACGFQLRGSHGQTLAAELKSIYIQTTDPYNDVILALERGFKNVGTTVVATAAQSPVTFDALRIGYQEKNVSVGGSDQSEQYIISYQLDYELRNQAGQRIYGPQRVNVQNYLATNANEVISSSSQLADIQNNLHQELVQRVFYQLESKTAQQAIQNAAIASQDTLTTTVTE